MISVDVSDDNASAAFRQRANEVAWPHLPDAARLLILEILLEAEPVPPLLARAGLLVLEHARPLAPTMLAH